MFSCNRCGEESRDGAHCSVCLKKYDFQCAGITETGYRKVIGGPHGNAAHARIFHLGHQQSLTWKSLCPN